MESHFEFDREEDAGWIADIPELPGVMAYGAPEEEAKANAQTCRRSCACNRNLKPRARSPKPKLVPQSPHDPTRNNQPAHEHGEAVEAVADLVARRFALGDSEDDRRKD